MAAFLLRGQRGIHHTQEPGHSHRPSHDLTTHHTFPPNPAGLSSHPRSGRLSLTLKPDGSRPVDAAELKDSEGWGGGAKLVTYSWMMGANCVPRSSQ